MCDNLSALMLSHNHLLHVIIKHIKLDIHFVHESVVTSNLGIQHVHGSIQVADALTIPLPTNVFQDLRTRLKVVSLTQH